MMVQRKPFPAGAVRECQQYTLDGTMLWVWDFAWKDPASGRLTQYNVRAYTNPGLSDDDFAERVRRPAPACIEREIHRKCGMDYAMVNRWPLSLPRTARTARFV